MTDRIINSGERVVVYIPPGAKINVENKESDPPKSEYNNRMKIFDLSKVKHLVGGTYGRLAEMFRGKSS